MRIFHRTILHIGIAAGIQLINVSPPAAAAIVETEPNVEVAKTWWEPQRNVWTPIGWKDHLFRFNILYNGTILVAPQGGYNREYVNPFSAHNMQLTFAPGAKAAAPSLPKVPTKVYHMDGGLGQQGWDEGKDTPVLWTEYPRQDGIIIKQEIFAHLKGGSRIESGVEPLYAWVRLSISHVDPRRAPESYFVTTQFSRLYTSNIYPFGLDDSVTLMAMPDAAPFKDELTWTPDRESSPTRYTLTMPDGNVRATVLPGTSKTITFSDSETSGVYNLAIELPSKVGAYADILIPFLPENEASFASEIALGRDKALAQAEAYWNLKPETAARIYTPEPYINEAIRRNLQFAELITERNPVNKSYTFLSGSYGYDALWSTPTSMISHMFLDLLGYHEVVDKHIELLREYQGTVRPPGESYTTHPGYLATPAFLKTFDWLADHGANLETVAKHALLTGDSDFIEKWTTPTVAACEFLKESCSIQAKGGIAGLLPPAAATDTSVPSVAVWNQAWNYKGLVSAVKLLKLLKHPRAEEFETFADSFRIRFEEAFHQKVATASKWEGPDGKEHPVLPTDLVPAPAQHIFDDAFLLDTGPLVLPFAGLLNADDPLMKSFADFFRVGPNVRLWGPRSSPIARAILRHEISSCEPCYSWNIVNSAKSGDRQRFLEGMYSLFTGAISNQTYINGEHRNAMYGTLFVAPLMTWCMRQAIIDDELVEDELHLLRLVPLAWLSQEEETIFENMPTIYGPVDLRFKLSKSNTPTLEVSLKGRWRTKAPRMILHTPPLDGLGGIRINDKDVLMDKTIEVVQ